MRSIDYSLYLVIHPDEQPISTLLETIGQAVKGGVTMVQLRAKKLPFQAFCAIGKSVQTLLNSYGVPLIINDRLDVVEALQCEGLHLGQSDISPIKARNVLGSNAIIGLSVSTLDQAKIAQSLPIDYLAASPLFETLTKNDCDSPWGLEGLRGLCQLSPFPVVAIGGINVSNVEKVFACGVSGIAVVSAICSARSPFLAAQELSIKHSK